MDIANIGSAADTAIISIYHPSTGQTLTNNDGSEMTVEVYGSESSTYRNVVREQQDRRMARIAKTGKSALTSAELEANQLEVVVKAIKGWTITLNGETPEVTRESVEKVLTSYGWLRVQIEDGISNSANFLKG
jgi:hypothetical protein